MISRINTFQLIGATSHWQLPPSPIAQLYGNKDYYVNAVSGNDGNDGLTAGTAFQTMQHAQNTCALFNQNGYSINIHVADGNYGPVTCPAINGSGGINYIGNTANPQNVGIYIEQRWCRRCTFRQTRAIRSAASRWCRPPVERYSAPVAMAFRTRRSNVNDRRIWPVCCRARSCGDVGVAGIAGSTLAFIRRSRSSYSPATPRRTSIASIADASSDKARSRRRR